jgi:hypothetical protein
MVPAREPGSSLRPEASDASARGHDAAGAIAGPAPL